MATIYTLKSSSGIFHFYGDLTVKGKRYRRYLGLSKKTAVLALQELEYNLRFGDEDKGVIPITYSKAILKFLVHLEMSGTGSTQIKYVSSGLEAFRKYCSTQGVSHMNDASKELCRNHMVEYSQSKLYNFYCPEKDGSWKHPSVKSQNNRISQNKRFFAWCIQNDYCNHNPWLAVPRKRVKGANKPRYFFSDEDLELVFASAGKFYDFYKFLLLTGVRSTDSFVLHASAFSGNTITLQQRKTGDWLQRIPISKEVIELLSPRIKRGGLVFPELKSDRMKRKSRTLIQELFEPQFVREHSIRLHTFRFTYAMHMLNRGVPKAALQTLLGHKLPTMTNFYATWISNDDELSKWVE